jgi:hypothetical protein
MYNEITATRANTAEDLLPASPAEDEVQRSVIWFRVRFRLFFVQTLPYRSNNDVQ